MDSLRLKSAKLVVSFLQGNAGSFPKQSEEETHPQSLRFQRKSAVSVMQQGSYKALEVWSSDNESLPKVNSRGDERSNSR